MNDVAAVAETKPEPVADDEAALWAELEKEDGADEANDDGSDVEATAETAEAEAETDEKPAEDPKKEPLPYAELAKRHKDLQGALHAERARARQMAERAANMDQLLRQLRQPGQAQQQPQADQIPDINTDPVGHFQAKSAALERQIEELKAGSQKTAEQIEQQQVSQRFWSHVTQSEAQMRQQAPDYDAAVGHLEQARVAELEVMFPDDHPQAIQMAVQQGLGSVAELRAAVLNQDRIAVATQALQMGMSPAELYYRLAHQRGYQKAAPAAPKVAPVQAIKRGQAAAKSLSAGGGGRADATPSLDALADMYLTDPDAADKAFAKLKTQGLLG